MGNANHISARWKNLTHVISNVNNPEVAWKTLVHNVHQITAEIPSIPATETEGEVPAVPATYRLNVFPIDLNDKGAKTIDVQVGYNFMDYFGQVYDIIEVNGNTIVIADIFLSGYCPPSGRPAMIYNDSSISVNPPPPQIETKWVVVSKTCLLDEGLNNTGQQEVVSKKQQLNDETGLWEDTGETTKNVVTNHNDCPPPQPDPYRIAVYVGPTDYDPLTATEIPFSTNPIEINMPTKAGFNYAFFSTPTALGKPTIKNSLSKNVSYQYDSVGADNKAGYQPNTIWKRNSTYLTDISTVFTITV